MNKRLLGIDYGLARIGLALSDPMGIIASPLCALQNHGQTQKVIDQLIKVIEEYKVRAIIIGMPLQLDGRQGDLAQAVDQFVDALKQHIDLPIITRDERLTTKQTERAMKSGQVSRKKRKDVIDAACAALILQNYLDQQNLPGSPFHDELLAHEV